MMYLVIGWRDEKIESYLWFLLFSQATNEYTGQVRAGRFTKVGIYKVDLKLLTVTLISEE